MAPHIHSYSALFVYFCLISSAFGSLQLHRRAAPDDGAAFQPINRLLTVKRDINLSGKRRLPMQLGSRRSHHQIDDAVHRRAAVQARKPEHEAIRVRQVLSPRQAAHKWAKRDAEKRQLPSQTTDVTTTTSTTTSATATATCSTTLAPYDSCSGILFTGTNSCCPSGNQCLPLADTSGGDSNGCTTAPYGQCMGLLGTGTSCCPSGYTCNEFADGILGGYCYPESGVVDSSSTAATPTATTSSAAATSTGTVAPYQLCSGLLDIGVAECTSGYTCSSTVLGGLLGKLCLPLEEPDADQDDCSNTPYQQCGGLLFTGNTCCPGNYTCSSTLLGILGSYCVPTSAVTKRDQMPMDPDLLAAGAGPYYRAPSSTQTPAQRGAPQTKAERFVTVRPTTTAAPSSTQI